MNKPAAIYARVSSDRQKENHTIASQTAALVGAVKLVDDLAGASPASARFPVGTVVISGDGAGDQAVGSPEVNVLVGWM
jgi:hypothetical protein